MATLQADASYLDGIRIGVQVVGRPFDDGTAFTVASAIELLRPWTGLAPELSAGRRADWLVEGDDPAPG